MIRLKYYKIKRVKLKDLIPKGKNLLNLNVFFNYKKFRREKWDAQRGKTQNNLFYMTKILKRYNLNELYFYFCAFNLLNVHAKPYSVKVINIVDFRFYLFMRYRLLKFFYFLRFKQLKKLLIHRHFYYKFDSFDNNLIMLLMRLGFMLDFRRLRWCLQNAGILKNGRILQDPYRCINSGDLVKISRNLKIPYTLKFIRYNKVKKRYRVRRRRLIVTWLDKLSVLALERWSQKKHDIVSYTNELLVSRILPMPFPINYETMSFIYIPFQIKNQWTFFYNMFFIKRFLQYGR